MDPPSNHRAHRVDVHLPPGGPLSGMAADVRAGLTRPFKELSPRYFYDERGSQLFEEITELPEYYPTRCEREILESRVGGDLRGGERARDADRARLRLGCARPGCCSTRCATPAAWRPTARSTSPRRSPGTPPSGSPPSTTDVAVRGLVCDFELDLERIPVAAPRVIALLGGTIGNFEPQQRAGLPAPDRQPARPRGPLPARHRPGQGPPRPSRPPTTTPQGVTAEFNKNVLAVLNRELGADFDLDSFEHVARWDPENLWVDIRLRSLANQVVERLSARHAGRLRAPARRCEPRSRPSSPAPASRGSTPRPGSS